MFLKSAYKLAEFAKPTLLIAVTFNLPLLTFNTFFILKWKPQAQPTR